MRENRIGRKVLALLMAVMVVLTLLPLTASADEAVEKSTNINFPFGQHVTALQGEKASLAAFATGPQAYSDEFWHSADHPEMGEVTFEIVDEGGTNPTGWKVSKAGVQKGWQCQFTPTELGTITILVKAKDNDSVIAVATVEVVDYLVKINDTKLYANDIDAIATTTTPIEWKSWNHAFMPEAKTLASDSALEGRPLEDILAKGGVRASRLSDDQVLHFIASDGVEAVFTAKQLFRDDRYYFPNMNLDPDYEEGAAPTALQQEGKTEFEPIISSDKDKRLFVGQAAPNERSAFVCVKNMLTGSKIVVDLSEKAAKINCDVTASKASGSTIEPGTQIDLASESWFSRDIYYTTDGTDPSPLNAAIYNYRTKVRDGVEDGGMKNGIIKAPDEEGAFVVKVMQMGFGEKDSDVKTFTYTVKKDAGEPEPEPVPAPAPAPTVKKGKTYKASGQSYKVAKVATKKAKGTVTFTKAKNAKSVTVPKTVKLKDGKVYNVTAVGAKAFTGKKIRTVTVSANVAKLNKLAFKGSKATKIVLKTKKLKKATVKGSLKGSKVKTVQVKVGKKKINKTYVKKYKKIFTKKNAGKKVKVK